MNQAAKSEILLSEVFLASAFVSSEKRQDLVAPPFANMGPADSAKLGGLVPASPPKPALEELAAIQALLDRSTRTATPAVADSVAYPARQMTAAEFVEFWRSIRLVAMSTVGRAGQPHIAPVHARLEGPTLWVHIYEDTVRRQDLPANPRVAFTTWRADGAAAILYGRARELPGSLRDARPGRSGRPRRVVTVEVRLTRIYAMRALHETPSHLSDKENDDASLPKTF